MEPAKKRNDLSRSVEKTKKGLNGHKRNRRNAIKIENDEDEVKDEKPTLALN